MCCKQLSGSFLHAQTSFLLPLNETSAHYQNDVVNVIASLVAVFVSSSLWGLTLPPVLLLSVGFHSWPGDCVGCHVHQPLLLMHAEVPCCKNAARCPVELHPRQTFSTPHEVVQWCWMGFWLQETGVHFLLTATRSFSELSQTFELPKWSQTSNMVYFRTNKNVYGIGCKRSKREHKETNSNIKSNVGL